MNMLIEKSLSIVSHGQGDMVSALLNDLRVYCDARYEVILTINIPEILSLDPSSFPFNLIVIENLRPRGFGANHNSAFCVASGKFFFILNPDVRLSRDPFSVLIECFHDDGLGVIAPGVVNSSGEPEDSARPFPSPYTIFAKIVGLETERNTIESGVCFPDWVAGMFMLFPSVVYRNIGGFDESYFLYYEDVDICARLSIAGYRVALCTDVVVVHDAHRSSHRSLKYLAWHVVSMLRFFSSTVYRQARHLSMARR